MVLPDPVGPVIKIIPVGRIKFLLIISKALPVNPNPSRVWAFTPSANNLITIFSPLKTGSTETLTEYLYSSVSILNRPSCGSRCSSSFKLLNTFILATIPSALETGNVIISCKIPSMRNLAITSFSMGSMWTSEASCKMACFINVSTIFTMGSSCDALIRSFLSTKISSPGVWLIPPFKASCAPKGDIMSLNSTSSVCWYWRKAFLMPAGVVSRGNILSNGSVFLINSMVFKSSGSSIATSKLLSFFRKAIILWDRAICSGIVFSTCGGMVSSPMLMKGIPRRYAWNLVSFSCSIRPFSTKTSPIFLLVLRLISKALSKSFSVINSASKRNFFKRWGSTFTPLEVWAKNIFMKIFFACTC